MTTRLQEEQTWLMTGSLVILAIVALAFGLSYTRPVLIPFLIAVFITSIVSPVVDYQILKLRFPRSIAIALSMLVVILICTLFCLLVMQATQEVVRSVDDYSTDFANLGRDVLLKLQEYQINISPNEITDKIRAEVPRWATTTAGNVAGILGRAVLVFIFVGFLLAGRDPRGVKPGIYRDIDAQIRRYLGTKLVISAVTGVLVGLILHLFGVRLAFVFGLAAFVLNFIPSVGSIIATLLPLPTAAAQFQGNLPLLIMVVAVPGMVQMLIGNVIEPKVMGDGLRLHPVTILLALAIWGLLWGPAGMLLAVPIMGTIRIVLDQFEITQPAGHLLAGFLPGTLHRSSLSE